jgi:hypothetical protein
MDADTELNHAVDLRIAREEAFKKEIVAQIDVIATALEMCDPTNAASTLDLSQEQLRNIIEKLTNMDSINGAESARISNILKTKNLRRAPEVIPAAPAAPGSLPAAPAVPIVPGVAKPKSYAAAVGTTPPRATIGDHLMGSVLGQSGAERAQFRAANGIRGGRRTRRKGKSKRIV